MAYTQSDLDRLKSALASGVMKVRYADGSEITYRTTAEILQAIATVERALAGSNAAPRVTVAGF